MSELDAVLFANEAFYRAFADREMAAMADVWAAEAPVSCIHPGWGLLEGLDEVLRDETGLPVSVAEEPLTCVALGTGRALEDPVYRGVLQNG